MVPVVAPERFEVTLINGDFLTYQFEEGAYDVVYSAHTHEHFDDFVTVNKRIHSLLKPDGHLLLILPTFRFAGFNGQGFINVFHNFMFTGRSLWNMLVLGSFQPITICYPFRHSQVEVWGLGRRVPSVDLRLGTTGLGL